MRSASSAEKKALARSADSFTNFIAKMGLGNDNITTGGSYGFNPITRQRQMLEWIHRGSWLGGVAIDLVADDMTRAGIDIRGRLPSSDAEKIHEEFVRLKLWKKVNQTIKWSRLYGGAIGVILIDGQDPQTPFRLQSVGKDQFRGLMVLDRWQIEPSFNDLITELGPEMGLPKYYKIMSTAQAYRGMKIHHTRCLRLVGIELPFNQSVTENLWGLSVLERIYDRMIAYDSATTGASQLVYKAYIRTYSIEGLRTIASQGGKALDGLTKYVDMMRRFQSIEGVTLLDAKDKFEGHVHNAFSGIAELLLQLGQQLSGALQIPLVRLLGQSPTGLNASGESDLRTYYDGIRQRQVSDLTIPMTAMFRATAQSLGISIPDGFVIDFKPLWQLTDTEKSEIASKDERTTREAHEAGIINRQDSLKELRASSYTTGRFESISDEEIRNAEYDLPPLPVPVQVAAIKAGTEVPEGREAGVNDPSWGRGEWGTRGTKSNGKPTQNGPTQDSSASTLAWHTGLYMVIENPAGSVRRGKDWESVMPVDYGYIRAHTGADGDQLDAYLGPDPSSPYVFVIDQLSLSPAHFDEHKVMLGFDSQDAALAAYIKSWSDGSGPARIGAVTSMSVDQFKAWITKADLQHAVGDIQGQVTRPS